MSSAASEKTISKTMLWAGWLVSVLPALMLLFSATGKFLKPTAVVEGFGHLGWPHELAFALGVVELVCTVLYLVPQTAVLGAILVTGYLGGAIATHVRIDEGFIVQALLGVLVWLGLYLRDARLRALIPIRS